MSVQSELELIALLKVGRIVAQVRDELLSTAKPGITTAELDDIARRRLLEHGAVPAPRKMYNFPGTACISLNHTVAHGIPDETALRPGDLVNIDVSAELNGYYADTGATLIVQPCQSPVKERLLRCSQNALQRGIHKARTGGRINQIGLAIYKEARKNGYNVIRNLSGHGIGRSLHEEPDHIVNYYDPQDQRRLNRGLVLAVETFVSTGIDYVVEGTDGWALQTPDGSLAAQFEHTIVVTDKRPIVLTA